MSISEHANLAEYIERAILGCIFRLQSSTKNVKNKSRKRALLCSVRSVNELNDPLITSGDAFWWVNSLDARRCQLGSILLLGPVRYAAEVATRCKHSARFAGSDRMEESTGGRGGRSSSDWAASKRLPFSSLPFSKSQIFDKHVFYSNLLEKCIGEAPDAF